VILINSVISIPPTVDDEGIMFSGMPSGCPSVRPSTTKLGTYIHHVSGIAEMLFKVREVKGQGQSDTKYTLRGDLHYDGLASTLTCLHLKQKLRQQMRCYHISIEQKNSLVFTISLI